MDRVFRELKRENHRELLDIAATLDEPFPIVFAVLNAMVMSGYIGVEDERYYIKYVLDPIPEPMSPGKIQYGEVLAMLPAADEPLPDQYMNPDVSDVVHRDQGSTGSCVGQATAYGRDLDLIRLTGQRPDAQDLGRVLRNIDYNENLWYDVYYRQSMSAEYAYRMSRIVGNVKYPSGSYLSASLQSLKTNGICLHDQWWNPKSGLEAWGSPHPGYFEDVDEHAEETAPKHRISGYAVVDTWGDVCRAIHKHGYVLGSILVWDNYCSQPTDPKLPEPRGSTCGAHALCFIGYDKENLYFLHSWWGDNGDTEPTWNKIGHISRSYFNMGFLGGYVVLDEDEAAIAFALYTLVEIRCKSWPDAELHVADGHLKKLPVSMMMKVGETYPLVVWSPMYRETRFVEVSISEGTTAITLTPNVTPAMYLRAVVGKVYKSLSRIFDLLRNRT